MNEATPASRQENGSKLETLPTEVLTHILSYKGMTQPTIRLFLTGATTLRQKVCRSATIMHFKSHLDIDFSLLPSILGYLSNLRELSIICDKSPLISITHTLSLLRLVSPTLEKLVFRFCGSAHLFEPGPRVVEDRIMPSADASADSDNKHVDEDYVDLAKHFPRLQWLEMSSESDLHCSTLKWLPATLTRLECRLKLSLDDFVTLPTHLIQLKVESNNSLPQSFFDALPPRLEHLDLYGSNSGSVLHLEQALALPRSLKTLVMAPAFKDFEVSSETASSLPPRLEALMHVHWTILEHLPPTMTRLDTSELSIQTLRQLPPSLLSLSCRLNSHNVVSFGDFPPDLTYLNLQLSQFLTAKEFVALLPSKHLTTLFLSSIMISSCIINQLPTTLKTLNIHTGHLNRTEIEVLHLPPNLTSATISCYREAKLRARFANMPDTLTHLSLSMLFDLEDLFLLPHSLRSLSLSNISHMSLFDPSDPKTLDRIAYLRKMAHDSGFVVDENLPTYKPRNFGIFDLLPRTLTILKLDDFETGALAATAWQSLPKQLKTLAIYGPWAHKLDADALDYMPYDTVTKYLRLPCVAMKDEHVKRLKPELRSLEFRPARKCLLTAKCLPWMPRAARSSLSIPKSLSAEFRELTRKRTECLKNVDRQGFKALGPLSNQ